jgi:hypothetical protein
MPFTGSDDQKRRGRENSGSQLPFYMPITIESERRIRVNAGKRFSQFFSKVAYLLLAL